MRYLAFILLLTTFTFSCGGDQKKVVDEACKNVTCEEGMCLNGECANPTFCDEKSSCLDGFTCVENSCLIEITDLCLDVVCAKGECSKATGECVNKSVCSRSSTQDCLDGFACYDQSCHSEEEICSEVNCPRGVCDFKVAQCVHLEVCESDRDCLSGSFCNDDKACQENKCDADMISCPRGTCNPRSGVCENDSICSAMEDCIDGNFCIGTTCTPIEEACVTCTGNQECIQNANQVACNESANGCSNGYDCLSGRACNDGVCGEPVACVPDALEPNGDLATATIWKDVATRNSIRASICQGDEDFYLYNTRDSALFTGTLVVSVNILAANVGNGSININLLKDGASVATVASNGTSRFELRQVVDAVNVGEFVVQVSDTDLNLAGLEYEIFINLVDPISDMACQTATPLNGSAAGDTSMSTSTSLKPSCGTAGVKRESIFALEVLEKSEVTIALSQLNAVLSVRSACAVDESEIVCAATSNRVVSVLDAGTYFVVVEGVDADGAFGIAVTQKPVICNPGSNRCTDGDNGETCNATGTAYDAFACKGDTCDMTTGFCLRAPGDICTDAIPASQGFDASVDFSTLRDDYQSATCGSSRATAGVDYTFAVDLPPNTRLEVSARQSSSATLALLLVSDCDNIEQNCLAQDTGSRSNIGYVNTSGQTESLFIIADSRSAFLGLVNIKIDLIPLTCLPNTKTCTGSTVDICNDLGTALDSLECPYGCDMMTGSCSPASNDICSTAFDVSGGGTFSGTLGDYNDDYEPASCISFGAPGPDGVWSINALAGQILRASMTGSFDSSLYVVSDCADIAGTCGAGSDSGRIETIDYTIPADGVYYIITDAFSSSATGDFSLTVDLVTPICTPGVQVCSGAASLDTCRADGTGFDSVMCPGACDPGTNECVGNSCASPILINASGQYMADNNLYSNTYNPGSQSCTNHTARGNDVIYQLDGLPGDVVTATMTAGFDSSIYAVTDCADLNSCIAGADNGGAETISFVMPATGSIFIVADAFSTSGKGTFTLDIGIQTPNCATPGEAVQCVDAATLQYCDALGFLKTLACTCSNGACTQPSGDICADLVLVADQSVVTSAFSNFSDTYNPGAVCPNESGNFDGPDAVYAIDLAPDSILTVDLQTSGFGHSMYVTSDCSAVKTSCLWGAGNGSDNQLVYHSAQGGRHYVHVDTTSNSATSAFTATFSVQNGVCQPGSDVCNSNTNQTTSCSADGSQITGIVDCIGNCASSSACGGPAIINDSCATAYDVVGPVSFVEDLGRFTDVINPGSASCFNRSTPGRDMMYSVALSPNTVLDVNVDGSTTHTLAIVSDCAMPGSTCLAQDDSFGKVRAVYASGNATENVFVIIDHTSSSSTTSLDISFDLRPQECALGTVSCLDANTRQFCDPFYKIQSQPCAFGCNMGACEPPTNDLCTTPLDATAGGTFTVEVSDYAGDYNQSNAVNSCTGYSTAGPDGVWSVDALAGQVLDVTLDAGSSYDAALYISTDCMMIDNSCVVGSDSGTRVVEHVNYTIPADGTYFIIADAYSSSPTGTYDLTVTLTTP